MKEVYIIMQSNYGSLEFICQEKGFFKSYSKAVQVALQLNVEELLKLSNKTIQMLSDWFLDYDESDEKPLNEVVLTDLALTFAKFSEPYETFFHVVSLPHNEKEDIEE